MSKKWNGGPGGMPQQAKHNGQPQPSPPQQMQLQMFETVVGKLEPAQKIELEKVLTNEKIPRDVDDYKLIMSQMDVTAANVVSDPGNGQTAVIFQGALALPLQAIVGHMPKTSSRLVGPRGNAVGVEKALTEALGGRGARLRIAFVVWHDPEKVENLNEKAEDQPDETSAPKLTP